MNIKQFQDEVAEWPEGSDVQFVGIKWQDSGHPSAEEFPLDLVSVQAEGQGTIKIKFVTKPRNPQ